MILTRQALLTSDGLHCTGRGADGNAANHIAELAAFSSRREAAHATPAAKQLHGDKFGVDASYGWTLSTARRLAVRERVRFSEYIRAHGFALL